MSCKSDPDRCFSFADICSFRLDAQNHLIPCRSGSHLQHCRNIQCSGKFKCQGSFCMPFSYVCDGKWDCPNGEDESRQNRCDTERSCPNMIRCEKSKTCASLSDICDKISDCPNSDDEELCSLKNPCPWKCKCLLFALDCSKQNISLLLGTLPFTHVHFQKTNLSVLPSFFTSFPHVISLVAQYCNVKDLYIIIHDMHLVQIANVAYNSISRIEIGCFKNTRSLKTLQLSNNMLRKLVGQEFRDLDHLTCLNLSSNHLIHLDTSIFGYLRIDILSLQNNSLDIVSHNFENAFWVKVLHADNTKVCCMLNNIQSCTEQRKWPHICKSRLLLDTTLGSYTICVSSLILLLSVVPYIVTGVGEKSQKKLKGLVFTLFLVGGDAEYGITLLALWFFDNGFGGHFISYEIKWKSSLSCWLFYFLFLHFHLYSPGLLSLMSFARLMIVKYPFQSRFKKLKFISYSAAVLLVLLLSVSLAMTGIIWFLHSDVPVQVCSPFVDPNHLSVIATILTWQVLVVQVGTILFVSFADICLLTEIEESQRSFQGFASNSKSHLSVKIDLLVEVISSVLTWIPSCTVYVVCLLTDCSLTLTIWTIIAVSTINSVVHPGIFVLQTVKNLLGSSAGCCRSVWASLNFSTNECDTKIRALVSVALSCLLCFFGAKCG